MAAKKDADIYVFSGGIDTHSADLLIGRIVGNLQPKTTAYLFLATYGGNPDAAFRMVRSIKSVYTKFVLCVFGYCKSAGTLVALGADEIVMSDFGELGPLDIQYLQEDQLSRRSSGNDIQQSMQYLNAQAFSMFETTLLSLIRRSGGQLTTRTAAELSKNLVVGLLAPIYAQIDPIKLGEIYRSNTIAQIYGQRLNANSQAVHALVEYYPSHSFVIDRQEAQQLFGPSVVREPDECEINLGSALGNVLRFPKEDPVVELLLAREGGQQDAPEENDEEGNISRNHVQQHPDPSVPRRNRASTEDDQGDASVSTSIARILE